MASSTHDFHPDGSLEVGRTAFGTVTLRAECGSTRLTTYLHAPPSPGLAGGLERVAAVGGSRDRLPGPEGVVSTATVERGARRKAERRAFLEGRQHGVGGSDAAAIVGKDPDKFVWDVWDEKVLDIKVEPDELMSGDIKRGNAGEPHAIKEYAERTGHRVQVHRDEFVHPKHAWMKGNVDGVIHPTLGDREGLGILEVKCPRVAKFYEIRDEGLGLREVFQMQHYLGVTGLKWGAFAVFTAEYWDLTTFEIVRDDALIGWLIEEERKFWEDHVLTGRRPERPPPVVPTMEKPKGRATMRKDDAWLEAAVLVVARHYDLADAELQYAESEATLISLAPEEGALHLAGGGVTLGA